MGVVVDAAQMPHRHVGVDLGCIQPRVPEERLDRPQIGAVIQHVGRAGISGVRPLIETISPVRRLSFPVSGHAKDRTPGDWPQDFRLACRAAQGFLGQGNKRCGEVGWEDHGNERVMPGKSRHHRFSPGRGAGIR
jgi:hypothetical protein